MTNPDRPRHIEVGDGEQPDAAAEVTTSAGAAGTVRASLHAQAGHITPGSRASLVDAVMDLPEVQASTRLEATIPRGDGESLERLRERTEDAVTRPAGSTTLLDANIPSDSQPGPGQDPDGGTTSLPAPATGSADTGELVPPTGTSLAGRLGAVADRTCVTFSGHRTEKLR